jgi:hypothetical protein
MALEIPRALVEYILLGPTSDRRQLQDSPILGDVWIAFAREADKPLDLLITPIRTQTAGEVALAISTGLQGDDRRDDEPDDEEHDANLAYLQGIVAARLDLGQVLRVVVPMTEWWHNERNQRELKPFSADPPNARLTRVLAAVKTIAEEWDPRDEHKPPFVPDPSAVDRYIGLVSLILWVRAWRRAHPQTEVRGGAVAAGPLLKEALKSAHAEAFAEPLRAVVFQLLNQPPSPKLVWQISLNRTATPAIANSIPAVKADAARTLFAVRCQTIAWAVIDSGIDRTHPAFKDGRGKCRIKASFDFSNFRRIVSLSNVRPAIRAANLKALRQNGRQLPDDAEQILADLAADASRGRAVDWERVERLVTIEGDELPPSDHGTHVAGIIGASKTWAANEAKRKKADEAAAAQDGRAGDEVAAGTEGDAGEDLADGMCPDIALYDFRVLASSLQDTEFAVIAALQYIRHMNERKLHLVIHGANLSLSIPHDVRNYACGRTPVCVECERLVESGVVVVAAAGNRGYQNFETTEGSYEGYAAFSVTDPGNADGVITVGSTHRYSPHTYGVSFFSSRGPTGDGRPKPDLVAPGERVHAPVRKGEWGDHDGTSMAAPHVSGAAAMLMARYSELIGQPRRIKRILCESATDLGRERSFQGRGMLDVLRAFQSI